MKDLHDALDTIYNFWPNIANKDPLTDTGFVDAYKVEKFDLLYSEGQTMTYACGGNFFWHDPMKSLTPWVPLYKVFKRIMSFLLYNHQTFEIHA